MRRIDLDQDKWRFAAKECEMSSANQFDQVVIGFTDYVPKSLDLPGVRFI
jgi:hypothetical protein